MKLALISYHKNSDKIYPKEWIDAYRNSILKQTYKLFDIHECEYSAGSNKIFNTNYYISRLFPNFVHCMNYMITNCFEQGYDYVFNTNVDDFYSPYRIESQIKYLKKGYDLVSSNFSLVDEEGKHLHYHQFANKDINRELRKNHNIIGHPVVAYSKSFWNKNKYNPNEIPAEDLLLWKRAINNSKFIIINENLLFHRIHNNSVCKSGNR